MSLSYFRVNLGLHHVLFFSVVIISYRSTESWAGAVPGFRDERFLFIGTASRARAVSQRGVLSHDQMFFHYVQWYTYLGLAASQAQCSRKTAVSDLFLRKYDVSGVH